MQMTASSVLAGLSLIPMNVGRAKYTRSVSVPDVEASS